MPQPDHSRCRQFRRWVVSVVAAGVVVGLPAILFARAGGGQSYSGGSHSSGGGGHGGGDGDGVGYLIFQLIRLCFYYPKVGVPLLIVVVAVFAYTSRAGKQRYQTSVIRRGHAAGNRVAAGQFERMVRANDPSFTAAAFLERVSGAFAKIQEAWSGQDLSGVRPFISDAVYERFNLQFDEQRFLGYRNRMERVTVESLDLAGARSDAHFDHLDVRIAASGVDQNVRLSDGAAVSGSAGSQPFVEVWSFLRRRGATTRPGTPGLMEGNCPNCGGAIEMNQNAACQYCGALLRSGQYDWVLAEITQAFEWRPREVSNPPGVHELSSRDPGFNVQELEDRASVVFWRKMTADRLFRAEPLRKCALPSFCDEYERELRERKGAGGRTYYGECAVGSVDVRGVLPSHGSSETYDRALVEVRWSGTRFTLSREGRPERHEQSAVSRMLLVLARKPGAPSNPDRSISSAHCPTCGAPESGGASGACEFCGAALNDGSTAWALEEAPNFTDPRAEELLERLNAHLAVPGESFDGEMNGGPNGSPNGQASPGHILAWMIKTSLEDGQLDARERSLLESVAARHRVPADRLEQMIAAARAGTLDVPAPAGRDDARENLRAMAMAALADGKVTPAEGKLLRQTGQRLGLTEYDVFQLLRRTRKELYADARQNLRAARKNGASNGNGRAASLG